MRKILLLLSIILSVVKTTQAQVTINEEPAITKMMEVYAGRGKAVTNNTSPENAPQVVDGFRVQLMATTDRRKVDETQALFSQRYPSAYAGWSQAKPYYRVRVGAFTSRTDASNFLQKIKKDYPDAYVVPDRVRTSELSGN